MYMMIPQAQQSSPPSRQGSTSSLPTQQPAQGRYNRTQLPPCPVRKLSHEFAIAPNTDNESRDNSISYTSRIWLYCCNQFYVSKQQQLQHHHEPKSTRRTRGSSTACCRTGSTTASAVLRSRVSFAILVLVMMMIHPNISSYLCFNAVSAESSSFSSTFLRPLRHTSTRPKHESITTPRGLQQQPDRRTVLVIRILDTPEDSNTTLDRHSTLRAVLFDGGDDPETMPSVQKQMNLCSGNAILFVPQIIPNTSDDTFIIDILVTPNLISNQSNRNEWVEVMASIACDPDTGPLRNLVSGSSSSANGNVFLLGPDDDYYFTSVLRYVADHVIVLLPGIYPDASFLATAEINNRISMYSVPWATSLSTYMHELAHNLGLRHSGDTITSAINADTEYGDSSGYMGESMITPWTPQKCYNAAQHWQLGWFGNDSNGQAAPFRLSFSETATDAPSLPLRINVAAFVDYMNLASSLSAGSYDKSFVILVQVTSNIYLQYNGAKSYNIGTDPVYANEIVVVQQDTTDLTTHVLASLQPGESYVTLDTNRIIEVCDIIISSSTDTSSAVIDYATIAISDTHTLSTISSVCQDGPDYVPVVPSPSTASPTEPPTANTVVAIAPTSSPVDSPESPAPTTNGAVEVTSVPTATPTIPVSNDSNGGTAENDDVAQPTNTPIATANPNDTEVVDNTNITPTLMPSKNSNLRGSDTADNAGGKNTTAISNKSSAENGLPTSSIIYSVFGTILGAVMISIVVLFYLSRHSKPTTHERQNATSRRDTSTRPKTAISSSSSRSKNQQQAYVVSNGSSRTMKSPDGSPMSRCSDQEHQTKDNGDSRSKSTDPSATTRSSSQPKPKLVLERQRQPAVTTTCFNKSNKSQREDIIDMDNNDDDSSDDDDKSDTLSVILQQEIWKDRVHKILQSVFFVQDKDGTVTQMMPAAAAAKSTKTRTPLTSQPDAGTM